MLTTKKATTIYAPLLLLLLSCSSTVLADYVQPYTYTSSHSTWSYNVPMKFYLVVHYHVTYGSSGSHTITLQYRNHECNWPVNDLICPSTTTVSYTLNVPSMGTYDIYFGSNGGSTSAGSISPYVMTCTLGSLNLPTQKEWHPWIHISDKGPWGTYTETYAKHSDLIKMSYPVTMSRLEASAYQDAVEIKWEVSLEENNAGWNIYRSDRSDGPYKKLNSTPIAPYKHFYSYRDNTARSNKKSYYKVESTGLGDGKREQHGPVWAIPSRVDYDGSQRVDGFDLIVLSNAIGTSRGEDGWNAAFDLDHNGVINELDLKAFKEHFGRRLSGPRSTSQSRP